jgi:hypothetical protein
MLRDGRSVTLRSIREDDAGAIKSTFAWWRWEP